MSSKPTKTDPEESNTPVDDSPSPLADERDDSGSQSDPLREVAEAANEAIAIDDEEMEASDIEQEAPWHVAAAITVGFAQCTADGTCTSNFDPEELEEVTERTVDGTPGINELLDSRSQLN